MIALVQSPTFPGMVFYEHGKNPGERKEYQSALPVGLLLSGATSVSSISIEWPLDFYAATNAGLSGSLFRIKPPSAQEALFEIKNTSGLTWQQLAKIFHVSPRSLHHWMDGEAPDSIHHERLYRILKTIRKLPYSEPFLNRSWLLAPQADGIIPIDLLIEGEDRLFITCAQSSPARTIMSTAASIESRPLPPSTLMDAMQETLHTDMPGKRSIKAIKRRGREG